MINKAIVEQYLKANGVSVDAPDDDIKSILFSAKWHAEDIHTALMVLRENPKTREQHVDTLQKVFHSDNRLEPETISALLGIEVNIQSAEARAKARSSVDAQPFVIVALFALGMSGLFLLTAMWYLKTGFFFAV